MRYNTRTHSAARVSTTFRALLATPLLFQGVVDVHARRSITRHSPRRAGSRPSPRDGSTLSALTSLRKAVLQHVQTARARGASLSEIKSELQEIVSRLQLDTQAKDSDIDNQRELAAQIIKWTDGFYKRGD